MAKVKILSNPYKKQVAYFSWNDRTAEWNPISGLSTTVRNIKLSKNFKDFIKKANAASPNKRNVTCGSKELCFGAVYSFNIDEEEGIEVVNSVLKLVDNKMVPFGCDPAGNIFCIDSKDDQVYVLFHEEERYIPLGFCIGELETKLH